MSTYVETPFIRYWREVDAACRLLGKRPVTQGLARAAHRRHLLPAYVAQVVPSQGSL